MYTKWPALTAVCTPQVFPCFQLRVLEAVDFIIAV